MTTQSPRRPGHHLSRRSLLAAAGAGTAAVSLSGCTMFTGTGAGVALGSGDFELPTYQPAPTLPGALVSDVEGVPPLYTSEPRVDELVRVSDGPIGDGTQTVSAFVLAWGELPPALDSNPRWQELNDSLGVRMEGIFANSDTVNDQLSVLLAGGGLPDLVWLYDRQPVGRRAIRDGAFADLSETLSGDNVLRWPALAARPTEAWAASLHQGRIVGVPAPAGGIDSYLGVRTDVAEHLGIDPRVTDAEQLLELAVATSQLSRLHNRPLWGIGRYSERFRTGLEAMYRVGPEWQIDPDTGAVTHKIFTEGYAESCELAARLWAGGAFHPDAFAPQIPGEQQLCGLMWANFNEWLSRWSAYITGIQTDIPGADITLVATPGHDGGDPLLVRGAPYWRLTAITSQAASDPGRLELLLDVLNACSPPAGSMEAVELGWGKQGRDWEVGPDGAPRGIPDASNGDTTVASVGVGTSPSGRVLEPNMADRLEDFQEILEHLTRHSVPDPAATLDSPELARNGVRLTALITEQQNQVVQRRTTMAQMRERFTEAGVQQVSDDLSRAYDRQLTA